MPKMIQIRNVPDPLHKKLKVRAAQSGLSLSDYLLSEVQSIADKPSLEELLTQLADLPPVELENPAAVLRRQRDAE